jgi:hypothetical protein
LIVASGSEKRSWLRARRVGSGTRLIDLDIERHLNGQVICTQQRHCRQNADAIQLETVAFGSAPSSAPTT